MNNVRCVLCCILLVCGSVGAVKGSATQPQAELPSHFDWRDNGGNYMTSVKTQLNCGNCYSFAILGAMEAMAKISRNNPLWNLDLSEQQLLSCGQFPCEWTELDEVLDHIVDTGGITREDCMRYKAEESIPCSTACETWQDQSVRLSSWERVDTATDSIKRKLLEGPVVVGLWLYQDFNRYRQGVYKHIWGVADGRHYAIIVGWDDQDQAWILKNSWGRYWGEDSYGVAGERGWFRIEYGELHVQDEKGYALKVEVPECSCEDVDGDGFYSASCTDARCMPKTDCDNDNGAVHPGSQEDCHDGIDNDCNGRTDEEDWPCKTDSPQTDGGIPNNPVTQSHSSGCTSLSGTSVASLWPHLTLGALLWARSRRRAR